MGVPGATITGVHVCPQLTGVVPHAGGPIIGPGVLNVLIGGMPASVLGDQCVCVGPPDKVIVGSFTVFIGGKPAVRLGDSTAHGAKITLGNPTVLIG